MSQLVIRNKSGEYLYRSLGGLMIMSAGLQLFTNSPRKPLFWVFIVILLIAAVILFIAGTTASASCRLIAGDERLTIRWKTRLFRREMRIDEITEIKEDKHFIHIIKQNGKSIRLPVKFMQSDRRREVINFLRSVAGV